MGADAAAKLNAAILQAHEAADSYRLAELYNEAAQLKDRAGDAEASWFLTTQAYVFALEAGHPLAADLHAALKTAGRDE